MLPCICFEWLSVYVKSLQHVQDDWDKPTKSPFDRRSFPINYLHQHLLQHNRLGTLFDQGIN